MAMAEPTCVLHAFSYTSSVSNDANQGNNSMCSLDESVSFGRFMSDSLSWDKWSSFSRNRYVEEAEKYSKPGSVKQKKAYFEAHFKRMAALKAAALLEQANAAQSGNSDQQIPEIEGDDDGNVIELHNDGVKVDDGDADLQEEHLVLESPTIDQKCAEKAVECSDCEDNHSEQNPKDGEDQFSSEITEAQTDSIAHVPEMESGFTETDESHLECFHTSKDTFEVPLSTSARSSELYSCAPITEAATSAVSFSSPVKSAAQRPAVHPGKENTYTPIGRKSWTDDPERKRTPLRMSINREINRLISPVIRKIGSSSKASNKDCLTPLKTPAKGSAKGMANASSEMSPQSSNRRARALFDSSGCGSKAGGPRWQFLSSEGAKSPSVGRNKTNSPIIPKSFCLRSKDRDPRRKERLEEKFNAKLTENTQQQSKLKGKAKDVGTLRQSFCFGSKLATDSFREKERLVVVPTEEEVLGKKGRSRMQNIASLPPRKPALKNAKQKKGESISSSHSFNPT